MQACRSASLTRSSTRSVRDTSCRMQCPTVRKELSLLSSKNRIRERSKTMQLYYSRFVLLVGIADLLYFCLKLWDTALTGSDSISRSIARWWSRLRWGWGSDLQGGLSSRSHGKSWWVYGAKYFVCSLLSIFYQGQKHSKSSSCLRMDKAGTEIPSYVWTMYLSRWSTILWPWCFEWP